MTSLGSYSWLHDHKCHSRQGLQLAVGTDVLPSFTSPPPAAARGARIGSHRSDQAEASRSPDTDARRLLETRPEGLQELEPLSSTECESKTHRHRHRHTQTHRHMEGHTYVCTYMCVCAPLPYGHTHRWSQAPLPTNHCQSKWSVLTSPTHQDGPPSSSHHHCSDVGETWAALLAVSASLVPSTKGLPFSDLSRDNCSCNKNPRS